MRHLARITRRPMQRRQPIPVIRDEPDTVVEDVPPAQPAPGPRVLARGTMPLPPARGDDDDTTTRPCMLASCARMTDVVDSPLISRAKTLRLSPRAIQMLRWLSRDE